MRREQLIKKINENEALLNRAKKSHYLSDFYAFNRDVLGWPDIYEPLHKKVCDFVQDNVRKKKLLILLPRGSFKSSIITIGYTLWRIAQDPKVRIMITNAVFPMACQFLSQIKAHLTQNENFIRLFGDFSSEADSWREDRIDIAAGIEHKEPTVWTTGVAAGKVGSHFDLVIHDDVVSRENITTIDQINKVKNFFKDSLDLVDANKGSHKEVIVVGTTWHMADLYAWIQDKETGILDDFAILKMPAYEGEWKKGKLLLPPILGWKILEGLKRQQGPSHFAAQYLLNPVPPENALFKPPFRRYEETDISGVPLNKFITIDPAISQEKEADYSAMVCVGVDKNNDWYILDLWRERVPPKQLLDQMFYWDEKWKPVQVGIETVSFQKTLQYFAYEEMKKRNQNIPIMELKHSNRGKYERIIGLEPRYATGSIFHPQRGANPLVDALEDELGRVDSDGIKAQHDDLMDALASQLELAFPPKVKDKRGGVEFKKAHYPA